MVREVEAKLVLSAQDRTRKAFESIERRLKGVEKRSSVANRMSAQAARFEQAAARTTNSMYATTARIAAPLLAATGLNSGLRTLTSYEDALTEIQKKGGFSEKQMAKLGDEARALATSGELAVPLNEILSAYERGAAAGLPLEDLRDFAELSAKASDAFGMSAEEVGNAAAGFNVGLGIPIAKMESYFDLINSLADSGISDESDIIKYLDNAGAALKNFGLSANDAAAYGAAFLNLKLGPETAARMTNALTQRLIAPDNLGKEAYAVFSEFVGDVGEFKDMLKGDAQGALRKFLGDLAKLDKFERARVTGKIFGTEWSDEIMRVVEGIEEVDRNIAAARNTDSWAGSLEKSYQLKLDTMMSRWRLFQNQIGETVIDLGLMGLPALKEGLDGATNQVKELGTQIETFRFKVDMEEFDAAKTAVAELSTAVSELLDLGGDGDSVLEQTFDRIANAANAVSSAVNIGHDLAERIGLVDKDQETAEAESGRLQKWTDNFLEWNKIVGGAFDLADYAINDGALRAARKDRIAGREQDDVDDRVSGAFGDGGLPGREPRLKITPPTPGTIDGYAVRNTGEVPTPRFSTDMPALSEDLDASTDRLRQAMEASGAIVTTSGADAGSKLQDGAQAGANALMQAAQAIETAGRNAAAAISSVRIPLPGGATAASRPRANANLGDSMVGVGEAGQ
ncbi:phage tail tape measure protein [Aureimonas sp. OT7]|uniref:phage tail tape measure protein n=1 Tax=Aureimonas sp. OT7 TaxID=2816454 RepID=UPI001781B540|nr:phage tail tape measure protein [Aureimonas sp. OT7]QOG06542.1 phage tail tape measure protein [Aureimonas sp. OT7]